MPNIISVCGLVKILYFAGSVESGTIAVLLRDSANSSKNYLALRFYPRANLFDASLEYVPRGGLNA